VNFMAHRSFDSVTRIGLPQAAPKSLRGDHQGEQFADEGTLILKPSDRASFEQSGAFNPFDDFEPAPISVAPSAVGPRSYPPPPVSVRPPMPSVPPPSSVRPPMNSWDDRVWSVPVSERTGASAITSTSQHRKKTMSPRERSASAMLFIATAALLSALAAIGLMHKADRAAAATASQTADTAESAPPPALPSTAIVVPATTTQPSPLAAPVPPPVAAIDMDDVKPTPAPAQPAAPVQAAPKPAYAAAPVNAAPANPAPANAAPQTKTKEKAPSNAAQKKALEDLLDQLGEEQLKR